MKCDKHTMLLYAVSNRIIDAIYNMDGETLNGGARYELR